MFSTKLSYQTNLEPSRNLMCVKLGVIGGNVLKVILKCEHEGWIIFMLDSDIKQVRKVLESVRFWSCARELNSAPFEHIVVLL